MEKKGCTSSSQGNQPEPNPNPNPNPGMNRKRRKTRPAGNPDPDAEVVALQAEDLLAIGRYICNVCGKGFQRDQNLQLHLRSHNVAGELRRGGGCGGATPARRKAYVCPVATCVYSNRSRALSDITGIKKHFNRKHGSKNLLCPRCSKPYAVEADLKAHIKTHGAGDYRCECGAAFTRRNAYEGHRGFCCKVAAEGIRRAPKANSVTRESSADRARVASFSGHFELPDMNEEFVHPDDGQDGVVAEQPINADLASSAGDQKAAAVLTGKQLHLSTALMPGHPDFFKSLPPCLAEMLKSHYEEVIGGFLTATSPPPAVGTRSMMRSSPTPASETNYSALDLFGGASSSFVECGAAASSQGSADLRAKFSRSNSTHNGDFLSLLSTPAMTAPDIVNGSDDPMFASLAFRSPKSVDHRPYQASKPPGSSATALLQMAGSIGAIMNSSCLNIFQLRQESDLADAVPPDFLTLTPNSMNETSKRAQERNTTSASSSFFGSIIKSMDAYSQQRESRPDTCFIDFFTASKATQPYSLSSTAAGHGGRQQPEVAMSRKGKEVVGAGHCDEQVLGFFFGGESGHQRRF